MRTSDVVIAGAGIIGLATALELSAHGLQVTVLERGEVMREASWAAAGMLAAHDPDNPPALASLAEYSLAHYPAFLARVQQLSGLAVPLRTHTTLQAVRPGTPGILSPAELAELVPGIAPGDYLRLDEHSLDPRDLCAALPLACAEAGVQILTHTPLPSIHRTPDWIDFHLPGEVLRARFLIECRGAWAEGTSTPSIHGSAPSVLPRKGQICCVTLPEGGLLPHVVRTHDVYLVPRGDGRVIVGATVEDAGFDKQVHAPAIEALFARACALWPPLAQGCITDSWAGLRPATPDGLPILDVAAVNCWVAAGHYRNGILLAPGTARVMRQFVLGQPREIDHEPFRAGRFAAVEAIP